ncbi:MAG: hypothetical protein KME31_08545 [Tolypothrix carrinoi HA7290-LM1]|jgi:hypothetical protein|nr:hypothetical protein [Tolypothrix carrinoi HA7290-LM1]
MQLVKKTFLERLQYLQAELRAIAQSPELRQLVQSDYCSYDPDLTIVDAIHAVTEVIDAYEQNYCVIHLQAGHILQREEIQFSPDDGDLRNDLNPYYIEEFLSGDNDLGIPFG